MRRLTRSNIGYVGEDGIKPYGWNPGGFGCSGHCVGCWALRIAKRTNHCSKCNAFEVHLHEDRLCEPANTKKPGVVLVNFTCDTFDKERPDKDVYDILMAIQAAPQHTYVMLTKNVDGMACWDFRSPKQQMPSRPDFCKAAPNVYKGLTIRNQQDADEKLPDFLSIPGKLWISYEPAWGPVNWQVPFGLVSAVGGGWNRFVTAVRRARGDVPLGVIIGHDNRKGAPGTQTLEHVRSCVQQCQAAGVKVYVKQLWLARCPKCGQSPTLENRQLTFRCSCGGRLKRKLYHDPEDFPEDLRLRQLPWETP